MKPEQEQIYWQQWRAKNPNGTIWDYLDEGSTECDEHGKPLKIVYIQKQDFIDAAMNILNNGCGPEAWEIVRWHPRYEELYNLGILGITIKRNPRKYSQKNFVIETKLPYNNNYFTVMGLIKSWEGYKSFN